MKELNYMLNLFISYTEKDGQSSTIRDFVEEIESYSDVDQIFLCENNRNQDCFVRCLNFSNYTIDVCIFFCSEEAQNILEICKEVNLAFNSGLEIIPIYEKYSDIFPLIRHKTGVKIVKHTFNPQDVAKDVINIIRTRIKDEISN